MQAEKEKQKAFRPYISSPFIFSAIQLSTMFRRLSPSTSAVLLLCLFLQIAGSRGMVADCRPRDIEIYQSPLGFNPADHVPQFLVHIMNSSPHGKALFDVHVDCGLFASTRLVDPTKFKRIRPGDCLVKNGTSMAPNEIITFRYSNSFPYKLVPSSVRC